MREGASVGATAGLPSGVHRYAGPLAALRLRLSVASLDSGPDLQQDGRIKPIKSFILSARADLAGWQLEPEVDATASVRLELGLRVAAARCGWRPASSALTSAKLGADWSKLADVRGAGYATGNAPRCETIDRLARKLPQGAFSVRNKGTSRAPATILRRSQSEQALCWSLARARALLTLGKPAANRLGSAGQDLDLDWTRKGSDIDTDTQEEEGNDYDSDNAAADDLVSDSAKILLLNRAPKAATVGPDLALGQQRAAQLDASSAMKLLDPLDLLASQLSFLQAKAVATNDTNDDDDDTDRTTVLVAGNCIGNRQIDTSTNELETGGGGSKGAADQVGSQREFDTMTSERCTAEIQRSSQPGRIDVERHNVDGRQQIAADGRESTKANRDGGAEDTCLCAGLLGTGCARQTIHFVVENHGFSSNGSTTTVARTPNQEALGRPSDNDGRAGLAPPPTRAPPAGAVCLASVHVDALQRTLRLRPELGQPVALDQRWFYWLELAPSCERSPDSGFELGLELARHALLSRPALTQSGWHRSAGSLVIQLHLHLVHQVEPALSRASLFLRYQLSMGRRTLCLGSSVTSRANRRGHFNFATTESLVVRDVLCSSQQELVLSCQLFSRDFYRDTLEACAQVRLPVASGAASQRSGARNRLELALVKPELCSLRDKIRYRLTGQLPSHWAKVLRQNVSSLCRHHCLCLGAQVSKRNSASEKRAMITNAPS